MCPQAQGYAPSVAGRGDMRRPPGDAALVLAIGWLPPARGGGGGDLASRNSRDRNTATSGEWATRV